MDEDSENTNSPSIWDQAYPEKEWLPPDKFRGARLALVGFALVAVVAAGGWWAWRSLAPIDHRILAREILVEGDHRFPVGELKVEETPNEAEIRGLLWKSYLQSSQSASARAQLETAFELGDDEQPLLLALSTELIKPQTWLLKGELELARGAYERAQAAFEHALEMGPNNIYALSGLVRVLLVTNQLEAAREPVNTLTQRFPTHPGGAYVRALYAKQRGDYELALDALGIVLNHESSHAKSLLLLGEVQLAMGNQEQALLNLSHFHRLDPGSVPGRKLLARAFIDSGQPERAVELLKPLVSDVRKDSEIASILVMAYDQIRNRFQVQASQALPGKLAGDG
ncbi:MAG: tetratricopeptide repeat protein, partial [Lysobacterales bacterium]